jgi:CheY-like chemotaxis protein
MSKKTILVIDDEPSLVDGTAALLEAQGYNVLKAYDGVEGLELATKEHPDLVLLDALMPEMDGYEVLTQIKKRRVPTRVIMLTAKRDKNEIVKFVRAGACDYLVKGDESLDSQLNAIRRALEVEETIDRLISENTPLLEEVTAKFQTLQTCFVVMPIGSGEMYNEYLSRYENIIKPAIEGLKISSRQVYKSVRADFESQTGSITRTILDYLYNSEVVIADLSDLNPNVFYELGVRHSLRNKTILIAAKGTKPPFDVGDLRIIFYENKIGGEKKVVPELQSVLRKFAEGEEQIDSPVFHAIPKLLYRMADDSLEVQNKELRAILSFLEEFREAQFSNLLKTDLDEIVDLFSTRENSVVSKNQNTFLGTQLNNQEIVGGSSMGYLKCSKMTNTILRFAGLTSKQFEETSLDYAALVREDYEHNNRYSHTAFLTYHLLKTNTGIKIVKLKN